MRRFAISIEQKTIEARNKRKFRTMTYIEKAATCRALGITSPGWRIRRNTTRDFTPHWRVARPERSSGVRGFMKSRRRKIYESDAAARQAIRRHLRRQDHIRVRPEQFWPPIDEKIEWSFLSMRYSAMHGAYVVLTLTPDAPLVQVYSGHPLDSEYRDPLASVVAGPLGTEANTIALAINEARIEGAYGEAESIDGDLLASLEDERQRLLLKDRRKISPHTPDWLELDPSLDDRDPKGYWARTLDNRVDLAMIRLFNMDKDFRLKNMAPIRLRIKEEIEAGSEPDLAKIFLEFADVS